MKIIVCSDCGTKYDLALDACPSCGCPNLESASSHEGRTTKLAETDIQNEKKQHSESVSNQFLNYCGNCGTQIRRDATFCPNCGSRYAQNNHIQQLQSKKRTEGSSDNEKKEPILADGFGIAGFFLSLFAYTLVVSVTHRGHVSPLMSIGCLVLSIIGLTGKDKRCIGMAIVGIIISAVCLGEFLSIYG